jgi:RNA polymerase sigma-70 factor (ECF subfamily)
VSDEARAVDLGLDAGLVRRARAGSPEAFSRLVERHQATVRGFLRRACGNWAEADDLAQDTFVTAWSEIGRLRSDQSVRSWLCGVAWRKHLSRRRSTMRDAARDGAWLEGQGGSSAVAPEDRESLARAMAELPPEQRAAVALCLAADFSHTEAAEALRLPVGTVKSHVARGRAKLLEALS